VSDTLATLSQAGVSIWLDDLSRERLVSGSLAGLAARDHVVGVTTNPSIFAKAISGSSAYDAQLRDLATRGVDAREALRALTTFDVRWACDVLRPVYDATGGVDGRVSIEVDPRLAYDTAANTPAMSVLLHELPAANGGPPNYAVRVRFRIVPWIDPQRRMALQAALAAQQQAAYGTPGAMAAGPNLAPIAEVTLEQFTAVSKGVAAFGYDQARLPEIAASHGIPAAAWETASSGWNDRIKASPAVAQRFNQLYRQA